MRLVFMGTPDFAVPSLEAIVAAQFEVAAVITQPDKPRGRGMRLAPQPVKESALRLGLPVLQPGKVRDEAFISEMRMLSPDCIVVVAFGQLIPNDLLNLPPFGCVNVHPSLLPRYRGATPIQQAILDGNSTTGVSTMYLDEGMDTGDVILQVTVPISPMANAGQLHDELAQVGASLLVETLQQVQNGSAPRIPQDNALATITRRLNNSDGQLNWNTSACDLTNVVRAFTPWPGAYTYYGDERLKIWQAQPAIQPSSVDTPTPGQLLSVGKENIQVACANGKLDLLEVQPQNGSRMLASAYARGRHLQPGDCFCSKD